MAASVDKAFVYIRCRKPMFPPDRINVVASDHKGEEESFPLAAGWGVGMMVINQ